MQDAEPPPVRVKSRADSPVPGIVRADERIVILVGAYGSGKTEVSVNLALALAAGGRRVQIADLDLVNPYFRCREARALMEKKRIRVVSPPGGQAFADLPIVLPEIAGMLDPSPGTVTLFDVGGDDVGARALASLRPRVPADAQVWQVVNAHRPFSSTVPQCEAMRRGIEAAARLPVTGLVANTHFVAETKPEDVVKGWRLVRDFAVATGLPVRFVAAMRNLKGAPELEEIRAPVLWLERYMRPPWLAAPGPPLY